MYNILFFIRNRPLLAMAAWSMTKLRLATQSPPAKSAPEVESDRKIIRPTDGYVEKG